jgi:hypothetical protein
VYELNSGSIKTISLNGLNIEIIPAQTELTRRRLCFDDLTEPPVQIHAISVLWLLRL